MKILYNFNEKALESDMLIFHNGKWSLISSSQLLNEVNEKIKEIDLKIEKNKEILKAVDEKLAEYHDILNQLTANEGE